jgi:hypothetical protein
MAPAIRSLLLNSPHTSTALNSIRLQLLEFDWPTLYASWEVEMLARVEAKVRRWITEQTDQWRTYIAQPHVVVQAEEPRTIAAEFEAWLGSGDGEDEVPEVFGDADDIHAAYDEMARNAVAQPPAHNAELGRLNIRCLNGDLAPLNWSLQFLRTHDCQLHC